MTEETHMSAKERLHKVQAALEKRGLLDVKFYFSGAANIPQSHVMSDVADALQAYLDGRVRPMPEFGDSTKT